MSPRWILSAIGLFVLVAPSSVSPQTTAILRVMRGAVCTACSGAFIFRRCAPNETVFCRLIAFKLQLMCQSFPCINYGSNSGRSCVDGLLGCPVLNVWPLGLCEPRQVCCGSRFFSGPDGSASDSSIATDSGPSSYLSNALSRFTRRRGKGRSFLRKSAVPSLLSKAKPSMFGNLLNPQPEAPAEDVIIPATANHTALVISANPEEYSRDWPATEEDPVIVERAIRKQYDNLVIEVKAINAQETDLGREAIRIPTFDEFRAAALGENNIV